MLPEIKAVSGESQRFRLSFLCNSFHFPTEKPPIDALQNVGIGCAYIISMKTPEERQNENTVECLTTLAGLAAIGAVFYIAKNIKKIDWKEIKKWI